MARLSRCIGARSPAMRRPSVRIIRPHSEASAISRCRISTSAISCAPQRCGGAASPGRRRCGLDAVAWKNGTACADLTGQSGAVWPLSFDHACAHNRYKAHFCELEDLIKGNDLLIVPSGAALYALHGDETAAGCRRFRPARWRHIAIGDVGGLADVARIRKLARGLAILAEGDIDRGVADFKKAYDLED
jgi:hypothetical protein